MKVPDGIGTHNGIYSGDNLKQGHMLSIAGKSMAI